MTELWRTKPLAVLMSGGPDSAILLGELARTSPRVVPIYVRLGMFWDAQEERSVHGFAAALNMPSVAAPQIFTMPLGQVYGPHWSTTGIDVPDAKSPDSAVDLPGRNLFVLLQAAVWCHLNAVPTLALGLLKGNPFPDSTAAFFDSYQQTINSGLASTLEFVRPYATFTKSEVLRRGVEFPLELTWSCMQPMSGVHCGKCNKCYERQQAFLAAGLPDRTEYLTR